MLGNNIGSERQPPIANKDLQTQQSKDLVDLTTSPPNTLNFHVFPLFLALRVPFPTMHL